MVFSVFLHCGTRETYSHDQENNPCNLKPQLVQHPSESSRRGESGALGGSQNTAASSLLFRHSGDDPQLSCSRNLTHGSILTAFGATMTQTWALSNR
jgi:hypothetical protein